MAKLISMTKEIVEEFDVNNIVVFKQSSLVSNEQLEIANNLLTLFKNLQNNSDKYIFWTEITKQDQIDISFCPNNIAETLRKTVLVQVTQLYVFLQQLLIKLIMKIAMSTLKK